MNRVTRREVLGAVAVGGAAVAVVGSARAQHRAGRLMELAARPEPVIVDTARAAVLVVDMQNDFGASGGMFDRAGIDITGVQRAIAPTASVIENARRAGLPVVYLKMAYLPDLTDLGEEGSVNRARHLRLGVGKRIRAPDGSESRILIRDTWNTNIVTGLEPHPQDLVIYKTRFSGFYATELDERLQRLGVKHLFVTGCTTSICVEATVRDAMYRDYRCVLLADCTSEPIGSALVRTNHDASLLNVESLLGWVSDSATLIRALG